MQMHNFPLGPKFHQYNRTPIEKPWTVIKLERHNRSLTCELYVQATRLNMHVRRLFTAIPNLVKHLAEATFKLGSALRSLRNLPGEEDRCIISKE